MRRKGLRAAFLVVVTGVGLLIGSMARPNDVLASGCENDLCKDGNCNTPQNGQKCDLTPWGCDRGTCVPE